MKYGFRGCWRYLLLALTFVAISPLALWLFVTVGDHLSSARWDKITIGMTEAEVNAILGPADIGSEYPNRLWLSPSGRIGLAISFDHDLKVIYKDAGRVESVLSRGERIKRTIFRIFNRPPPAAPVPPP